MSDLKEKRELSRIDQKKCQFCNCSSYVKPECGFKKEITIVKIQSQHLLEVKSESMDLKENQLKISNAEQKDL